MKLSKFKLALFCSIGLLATNGQLSSAESTEEQEENLSGGYESIEIHNHFKDISPTYWAFDEINYLANLGVIKGYTNGNFGYADGITRAQAATMLARAYNLNTSMVTLPFDDVNPDNSHYPAISVTVAAGMFENTKNFRPNDYLTRGEMALALTSAYANKPTSDPSKTVQFKDVKPNTKLANAVNELASNGITTGYEDGTFRPDVKITRTHFAVFFARLIDEKFRE